MGLAIARTIVDAHGGRLEARNNPDGGATFAFTLPGGGARRHEQPGPRRWCPSWTMTRPCGRVWRACSRRAGYAVEAFASAREFLARPPHEGPAAWCWTCGCPA